MIFSGTKKSKLFKWYFKALNSASRIMALALGVVASIVPFNFPSMVPNWTLPNAISTKLSMATKLDDFTMPELDFEAFADSAGNVLTYSVSDK